MNLICGKLALWSNIESSDLSFQEILWQDVHQSTAQGLFFQWVDVCLILLRAFYGFSNLGGIPPPPTPKKWGETLDSPPPPQITNTKSSPPPHRSQFRYKWGELPPSQTQKNGWENARFPPPPNHQLWGGGGGKESLAAGFAPSFIPGNRHQQHLLAFVASMQGGLDAKNANVSRSSMLEHSKTDSRLNHPYH